MESENSFNNLPDEILQHILSFLETKEAVQCSLLSRRWRNLWRSLPLLRIDSHSFRYYSSFSSFVQNLLLLRSPPLSSCTFLFDISNPIYSSIQMCADSDDLFEPLVATLIRHVTSLGIRTLTLLFPRIVDSLPLLFSCASLNSLHLHELVIPPNFFGFSTLTTLHLVRCSFLIDGINSVDLFRDFVHLTHLSLRDCRIPSRVKFFHVSAPHLADLTISDMEHVRNLHPNCRLVISLTQIASFNFVGSHTLRFTAPSLPCLQTVRIDVSGVPYLFGNDLSPKKLVARLVDMFRACGAAETVTLSSQTIRVLALFPDALRLPCPFSRMKMLKLEVPHESSGITTNVLSFLLNGSHRRDLKVEFLKQVPSSSMG